MRLADHIVKGTGPVFTGGDLIVHIELFKLSYGRFKKAAQRGCSERKAEAYAVGTLRL